MCCFHTSGFSFSGLSVGEARKSHSAGVGSGVAPSGLDGGQDFGPRWLRLPSWPREQLEGHFPGDQAPRDQKCPEQGRRGGLGTRPPRRMRVLRPMGPVSPARLRTQCSSMFPNSLRGRAAPWGHAVSAACATTYVKELLPFLAAGTSGPREMGEKGRGDPRPHPRA